MSDEEDIVLSELNDEDLTLQMHDDLYDGLADEIHEGVNILLGRGWEPYKVLTEALVEGMRIVASISAMAFCLCPKFSWRRMP